MWDSWKAGHSCKELTPLERCKNTEQLLGGTKNYSGYTSPQREAEKVHLGTDKLLSSLVNGQITLKKIKTEGANCVQLKCIIEMLSKDSNELFKEIKYYNALLKMT